MNTPSERRSKRISRSLAVFLTASLALLSAGCDDVEVVFNPTPTPRADLDPTPTPTQTATATPRASATPTVAAENVCRVDADCDPSFLICLEPGGFIGCGVCQSFPEDECDTDADCAQRGEAFICAEAGPELCPCEGPVLVCQEGCSGEDDCGPAETCNAQHRCVPSACGSGADCPQEFACEGNGTCARRACASDTECEQGFCVQGLCYERLGQCVAIPA